MITLKQHEMDCLKRIAAQPTGALIPCSYTILQHLLTLGLIEKQTPTSLPLEMSYPNYRITPQGSKLLQETNSE